jgi:lipoprotein-anchoring transpeptidase ErfK/SrfK
MIRILPFVRLCATALSTNRWHRGLRSQTAQSRSIRAERPSRRRHTTEYRETRYRAASALRVGSVILALFAIVVLDAQSQPASEPPLPPSAIADKVIVLKRARKLLLMKDGEVLKAYRVSLGGHPVGPKVRQGDSRTPEGNYVLDSHNAQSQFYRSIHISYPSARDLSRARRLGVRPGGNLFIHGEPNDYHGPDEHLGDWTEGCIAVTNAEMDEIWRAVMNGTPIEIKP